MVVEGGFTGNIPQVFENIKPSTLRYSCRGLQHPQRPKVLKSLSTPKYTVELYPPLDPTVEIFPHLTHGLDMTRGGPTPNFHPIPRCHVGLSRNAT
jgi:hypothetical protein